MPGPNSRLIITYSGQNGDYPDPVDYDLSDYEILQIAKEALSTGYIPGIPTVTNANLTDFVVDRISGTEEKPPIVAIRPKTPYGF